MSNGDVRSLGTTLPQGWAWTTLEDVTSPNRVPVQPSAQQQLPFIGMEYVEAETMRLLGTGQSSGLRSIALHFWPGDVLYGRLRPYLNKVLHADFEGLCSAEFIVFRDVPYLDSRYLQYFLNAWRFRDFAARLNEGDRPRVDWDQIKPYPFPLAPIGEQRRIVAAIEQQFTRLDAGVAALKRSQARLKHYRATVLKAAVEGDLTVDWRAAHPATETGAELLQRILAERRVRWEADVRAKGKDPAKVRYEEPVGPDTEGLPELPEPWCWASLLQLAAPEANSIVDGPFGSNLKTEHYVASGDRVIRLQNIGDGVFKDEKAFITHTHFVRLVKHQVFAGDVVIAALGEHPPRSCLIPAFVGPAIVKADCIRFKPSPHVPPSYMNIALNAEPTRRRTAVLLHGVGRPRLNLSEVKSIVLQLPATDEQQHIVAEVERRLSVVTALEATVEANLKRAERLRQSILREAFAGRLVSQDPIDEPASILLQRIRKEWTEGPLSRGRRSGVQQLEMVDAIAASS